MGPIVLLSLLGIGAATAFVDVMSDSDDSDALDVKDDTNDDEDQDLGMGPIDGAGDTGEEDQDGGSSSGQNAVQPEELKGPTLHGTDEADELTARSTQNIDAGEGNDTLSSRGSGTLLGGEGNDMMEIGGTAKGYGGLGEDYMHISDAGAAFGGFGNDTFILKAPQSALSGPAVADGGDGDDTFVMKPLSGLPEDNVAHILTGGAGADVYALDIDSAISVRDGAEGDNQIVARITDFDPDEDMLLLDIGAATNMQDVDDLPMPEVTTTEDPDGAYTDVHFKWTNPLNPDNVEIRTMRLDGVTGFSAGAVQLTSVFDPDSAHSDDETAGAAAHRLFALTPIEGTAGTDDITLSDSAATTLKGGDDTLTITGGSHLAYGGEGNDTMIVNSDDNGAAQLFGGEGDDVITADKIQNNDTALIGGEGDDTITFGLGHYVEGNAGADTLTLNVHPDALAQGPAVLDALTGNHLTINIPPELEGELHILNHTYSNGFEVVYSEVLIGDTPILKLMEEDFTNGVGIAENDPRLTIIRDAAL
ncbi:hypothetical protein [Shimia marina]|uniref:Uncharacterized protein n=1 Tax=Shimia marina TaxID=321267 RepID=A0A0P1EQA0_9RHOB|nr:hypothetical protein [Shimia marina]CUH52350.1 hypothetical protein SHM7688_01796 [Shimia marina]SFE09505.1 hypothetical protein SAMN04488037_105118 [Shimia marina]